MGRFNISDYTLVKDRLIAFREDYPQSTIDIKLLASNNIVDSPTGEMCNEYIMMATITPNPLADIHLELGALNFSPATTLVESRR